MSAVLGWLGLTVLMFWLAKNREEKKDLPFQTLFYYSAFAFMICTILGITIEYRCADVIASGAGTACMSYGANWAIQALWLPIFFFLITVIFLFGSVRDWYQEIKQKKF